MDQLRYDHLGFMGNDVVDTPNIDALAERGVACDRAYVNNPLCMPSRASLFTGQMPRDHDVRTNGIPLDREAPTVPRVLSENGYRTHCSGKIHLHNYYQPNDVTLDELSPEEYPEIRELWEAGRIEKLPDGYYGFDDTDFTGHHVFTIFGEYANWLEENHRDSYERLPRNHPDNTQRIAPDAYDWSLPEEHHYNRWIADRSRDFLEEAAESDEAFFEWCSFPDPHHPFGVPEPWSSKYDLEDIELPVRRDGELDDIPPHYEKAFEDEETLLSGLHGSSERTDEELRDEIAVTYGMISFVDQEIGRVLDKLDELGIRDDTVVVFLSDHGDMMGDHHMIRKGPFQFEGLLRIPMIWSWPDQLETNARTEGLVSTIDFAPTILDLCNVPIPEGTVPNSREAENEPPAWPGNSLRPQLTGETDSVHDHVIVENDEDYLGLRIRTLITDRYKMTVYPGQDYGELFDLSDDPEELHNRWEDSEYNEVKQELYRIFLEAYIQDESGLPRRLSHA
jgi:arylsulfatase